MARLFLDSRLVVSLLENAPRGQSGGEALFRRFVDAHESAGAALVWHDGQLALKIAEVFEPGKFRELMGSPAEQVPPAAAQLDRVPAGTFLIGSLQVDLARLYRM